jgi:VIT1/CCC1 family predicted Fe2+/Mn2+ transporter
MSLLGHRELKPNLQKWFALKQTARSIRGGHMKSAVIALVVLLLAVFVVIPVIAFALHAAAAIIPAILLGVVCYAVGVHHGRQSKLSPGRRPPTLRS